MKTGRYKVARNPRGHWLLMVLTLPVLFLALLFHGWVTHEVDEATVRHDCTEPVPRAAAEGGPVVRIDGNNVTSSAVRPGTVAMSFAGRLDLEWTPRMLRLLKQHDVRATFFVSGAQVARYPDLIKQIRADGHEIGSQTYTGAVMGSASRIRSELELRLTQDALAGTAGIHTNLLRMPQSTTLATLCGAEWDAARRASEDHGMLIVATDPMGQRPERGTLRQYSFTHADVSRVKTLLANPKVDEFTTVTSGVDINPAEQPVTATERWRGKALVTFAKFGDILASSMVWVLGVAGVLGLLRLLMLIIFARAHVRRLERFRPGTPRLREVWGPVTVIVPAYNEEAGIASTINSLLASTHQLLQIIVVDDGSEDRTSEIARSIPDRRITVIRQSNAGKAAALNTGLRHATCDIVVMVDADTVLEPDAISILIQGLAHSAVGAVSGNTKVGNRKRLLGRWQHLEYVFGFNLDRRMFDVLECMPTVPGAIGAFRREVLMGVGGVSDDTMAEDTDLTMAIARAGWRVVYEERAIAWTEVPVSLRQLWRQRYRWCFGTLHSMWKHRRALFEVGPGGRFGRRGLSYLTIFQVVLPLLAPVIDVYLLYGILFLDAREVGWVWVGFLTTQMLVAGYALRLDGERLRALWALPFQLVIFRQLMYLVVIQSVVATLVGTRLKWYRVQRFGSAGAAQELQEPDAPDQYEVLPGYADGTLQGVLAQDEGHLDPVTVEPNGRLVRPNSMTGPRPETPRDR